MSDFSENTKPTLVLLHGWGLNRAVWDKVLPLLPPDQSVLCLDLPGFGDQQSLPTPYTLPAITEQLLPMIPAHSIVLGWSLGGLVALQMAIMAPEKIQAIALVTSSPCFVAQTGWPGIAPNVLATFATSLQSDVGKTIERFMAIQAMGSASARQDIKQLKEAVMALPLPHPLALQGGLAILAQSDLRASLSAIACPVFACFGRLDALVPIAVADQVLAFKSDLHVAQFAKASHAPFMSHPLEFIEWLHQVLHSVLGSQQT